MSSDESSADGPEAQGSFEDEYREGGIALLFDEEEADIDLPFPDGLVTFPPNDLALIAK